MKILLDKTYFDLLATITTLKAELLSEKTQRGELVDFLGGYRHRTSTAIRKEESKVRPRDKVVYSLKETQHILAELQNRILDKEWKA